MMLVRQFNIMAQVTLTQRDSEPEICQSEPAPASPSPAFSLNLNCSVAGTHCVRVRCGPFPLLTNQHGATITVRGDLLTDNISQKIFSVTSLARLSVPELDHVLEEFDNYPNVAVYTTQYSPDITTGGVAVWVIVVSVFLSLIVLCLLILCLVRLKFFERKTQERKTLLEDQKAEAGFNVTVGERESRPLMTEQQVEERS